MPLNNAFDAFELFKKHGAAFDAAGNFAEFCAARGLKYLEMYAGGWAEKAFETAKAGKMTVFRPLEFPHAAKFSDVFTAAYFLPTDAKDKPHGACFLSGSRGGAPCGHMGGRRAWSERHPSVRTHYGAKFYGTYVVPRAEVKETVSRHSGAYSGYSYEAIRREDGILITANCSQIIGSVWLALLGRDDDISSMFDDETRAFIAAEKQAAIDAWGTE